jgi:signal transduction histidine kinase
MDLLNYTKLEQGHLILNKQKFALSNLVEHCCSHIRLDGDHFITQRGDLSLEVFADEQKIDQVLVNLVNNAVKYAPESPEIIVSFEAVGSMAKVSVADTGPGIPADKISHLFKRYYRADLNDYNSGLGLGLYICKEIITMHGGKIGVKSVPGKGTTFWFTIPLSK